MTTLRSIAIGTLAAGVLTLSACGGGGYGGDDSNPPPSNPPPVGGITRTGAAVAIGPVTGFGSIIVNGIHYETGNATFSDDGSTIQEAELEVGDIVVVQGTIDDDNTNAEAESVTVEDTVEGPVSSVDPVADSFVVLGQTVRISATTSADDSCDIAGTLDDLLTFAAVEVSGPYDANDVIQATRYECKTAQDIANDPDPFEINGIVSALDTTAGTFMINGLLVDYGSGPATIDNDFPGGSISEGDPVEASGAQFDDTVQPPVLTATRVEYKGKGFAGNAGDHIEIEGFITRFAGTTDFDVAGLPVTTTSATTFEGGQAADLGLNLKVEVEGEFDDNGTLVAAKVEIRTAKNVRVAGLVDSADGAANTFVVLGITVTVDEVSTRLEDKVADVEPFRVSDLNVNDYVEARGQELPAGSGELAAVIVERDDGDASETELRGFVESVQQPALTVLGVTIETNGQTVFRDVDDSVMSANDFFSAVGVGTLVDADGTETSAQVLLAGEVELENEN